MTSQTEVLVLKFPSGHSGTYQAQRDLPKQIDAGFEIVSFAIDPKSSQLVYTLVKRNAPEAD